MSVAKKIVESPHLRLVVSEVIEQTAPSDRELLSGWLDAISIVLHDPSRSRLKKAKAIQELGIPEPVRRILGNILQKAASKAWVGQSWARRLALVGLAAGTTVGGSVGIAAAGAGVGVSLAFMSTVGFAFLGLLVDEVKKETRRKP